MFSRVHPSLGFFLIFVSFLFPFPACLWSPSPLQLFGFHLHDYRPRLLDLYLPFPFFGKSEYFVLGDASLEFSRSQSFFLFLLFLRILDVPFFVCFDFFLLFSVFLVLCLWFCSASMVFVCFPFFLAAFCFCVFFFVLHFLCPRVSFPAFSLFRFARLSSLRRSFFAFPFFSFIFSKKGLVFLCPTLFLFTSPHRGFPFGAESSLSFPPRFFCRCCFPFRWLAVCQLNLIDLRLRHCIAVVSSPCTSLRPSLFLSRYSCGFLPSSRTARSLTCVSLFSLPLNLH